ncbi:MAG: hypothetical protein AAB515_02985 [Patescibacteria group bacterium]
MSLKKEPAPPTPITKDTWPKYGLQQLPEQQFIKVVEQIMRGSVRLVP